MSKSFIKWSLLGIVLSAYSFADDAIPAYNEPPAQLNNTINKLNTGKTRLYEYAGTGIYDASLEVTGRLKTDKYMELVGVSTPSTPSTSHSRIFLNSSTRQVCAGFDNGAFTCMSTPLGLGGSNAQVQFNNLGVLAGSANFTWTGSSMSVNGGVLMGGSGSAVTISSNTVMPGATFFQQGYIVMGIPGQSVTISSNAVLVGATFYQNATIAISTFTFVPSSSGILGTTDGSRANGGIVGESTVSVVTTYTNYPTTAQYGDLTSLLLTAGDWDVTAVLDAQYNGATVNNLRMGISTTSGNSSTGLNAGDNLVFSQGPTIAYDISEEVANFRLSLNTTTQVYLKYFSVYTVAIPQAAGRISARRIR